MKKHADLYSQTQRVRSKTIGNRIWKARHGYLFLLPVFLIMGIFKYYPVATAVFMSFFDWNGFNYRKFVGLGNFISMWSDDTFIASLKNVSLIAITDIIKILTLPLIAAELVFYVSYPKAKEMYKLIFVLPIIVPSMVVILMWKWIYNPTFGVLNLALGTFGWNSNHAWLGSADSALISIIGVGFPWIGGIAFLIYLGGLQAIPEELREAALIDGAGLWDRLTRIDLPLIAGQIKVLIILALIQSLNSFENVLVLTNGGPGNYTMVPALYLYQQGVTYNRMGYASAIGVFMFAVIFVLTVISYQFKRGE